MESGIGVKALTVAEAEAARDVDKVVGAYTRLYRRGYADGYADAKQGNPSHVVDTEAAAIGESISLFRTDTERLDALLEFHREFFSGPNKIDRASLDRWMEAQDAAMSADQGRT